jgi:hypothetical protein
VNAAAAVACPLCGETARRLGNAHGRDFLECDECGLTFVDPAQRLGPEAEHARYATHRNDPADAGYRAFLSRLLDPLLERLPASAEGLDYGSGPGPTLSLMLAEAGHPTAIYDPYFAPDAHALERTYDFITCTETVEHFYDPAAELERLDALLRPGGWLGVMTTVRDEQPLAEWWYARDATHVCFYRARTFEWIARRRAWTLERPHPNVALFRKADA